MLAKLCGMNLFPGEFANHSVAQTSVARTSAIVVRHAMEGVSCNYLLGESSTILYMWNCLIDAMREFDGQALNSG